MKQFSLIVAILALMMWACPTMGQSHDGKMCQFINIDKTVRAKLGEGEDTQYQLNSIKAFWPIMLNGKECPKLQEAICKWLTDKDDIKQMDRAIEYTLYTDIDVPIAYPNDPNDPEYLTPYGKQLMEESQAEAPW